MGRRRRRLPRSFLAEGPRASRGLSASRASSSPNSTGSSPAWPPPCRGRPSGRRGRTRRATMRACGLRPARRWASSACSCAGATWPLCRDAWRPGRCSRRAPCDPSSTGGPGPPCPCALGSLRGRTTRGPPRTSTRRACWSWRSRRSAPGRRCAPCSTPSRSWDASPSGRCSLSAPCGHRSRGGSATSERAKDGPISRP